MRTGPGLPLHRDAPSGQCQLRHHSRGRFPGGRTFPVVRWPSPRGGCGPQWQQPYWSGRKVVTVAVAAVTDALQRGLIGFSNNGAGLRAGTFHNDLGDPAWTLTLTGCAFAKDVSVSGAVVWRWGVDSSLTAGLQGSGPGTAGGTLHLEGKWQASGPVGQFTVSGTLGGRQVAVLIPEA